MRNGGFGFTQAACNNLTHSGVRHRTAATRCGQGRSHLPCTWGLVKSGFHIPFNNAAIGACALNGCQINILLACNAPRKWRCHNPANRLICPLCRCGLGCHWCRSNRLRHRGWLSRCHVFRRVDVIWHRLTFFHQNGDRCVDRNTFCAFLNKDAAQNTFLNGFYFHCGFVGFNLRQNITAVYGVPFLFQPAGQFALCHGRRKGGH